MGCFLARLCDPSLPDNTIRSFWHINGVILDVSYGTAANTSRSWTGSAGLEVQNPISSNNNSDTSPETNSFIPKVCTKIQKRPAGVLYINNGRLVYKSRKCSFSRNTEPLQIEICDIQDVKSLPYFTSNKDGRVYSGNVVDVIVSSKVASSLHLGFFTPNASEVSSQLSETCVKHRQKPKIFQFNSVDVDGVEIDLP